MLMPEAKDVTHLVRRCINSLCSIETVVVFPADLHLMPPFPVVPSRISLVFPEPHQLHISLSTLPVDNPQSRNFPSSPGLHLSAAYHLGPSDSKSSSQSLWNNRHSRHSLVSPGINPSYVPCRLPRFQGHYTICFTPLQRLSQFCSWSSRQRSRT
jgi:hypothetical protein